jgi:hypothetical protein
MPVLKPIKITRKKMRANFDYWLSQWAKLENPDAEVVQLLKNNVYTTHTFPYRKKKGNDYIFPYKSVFSDTLANGILSNGLRKQQNINPEDDKSCRNIPSGLENYVFAYLGIHQPYYAKEIEGQLGFIPKPFGVFITHSLNGQSQEIFPHHHSSRRDVGKENEDVDQKKIENEYLLPEDARKLMAYQIFNDRAHKIGKTANDWFWHYYGCPDYWQDNNYASNSWKKKAEFRFFEKIPIANIAAVLWPVWLDGHDENGEDIFSHTHEELTTYASMFPDCKFITYDLDLKDPEISYIDASYWATKYYLEFNRFPENVSIAKDILNT